jgi:PKD repeat protein
VVALRRSYRMGMLFLGLLACSDDSLPTAPPTETQKNPVSDVVVDATPTILAAGDIANCSRTQDNATGDLIRSLLPSYPNATVVPLGDLVYPIARAVEFTNCYDPAWGSFKGLTKPVVGNHEYDSASAAEGYTGYFGSDLTHPPGMYYSYDIGTWHIVVLNTYSPKVATGVGSAQDNWLKADLAANNKPCILGMMHHPRFFSSTNDTIIDPLDGFTSQPWQRLYTAGADLILTGHAHGYERFQPLTPAGVVDNAHGITEIVVGTGGESQANFLKVHPASVIHSPKDTYGVLRLSLLQNRYSAKFIATAGTFTDSVSVPNCHGAPPPSPPANVAPTADFSQSCNNLVCTFTDQSTDSDGIIKSRSWSFGDNTATGTTTPQSHTFGASGTYRVTLTVTDDGGATGTLFRDVTVGALPTTSFGLTVTTKPDATQSYAVMDWAGVTGDSVEVFRNSVPSGPLLKVTRTENDGHMGLTRSKTYEPIRYTFQLCSKGQAPSQAGAVCSNNVSHTFPSPTANVSPKAAFTSSCTNASCTFTDASTDSDGSIASRSWSFGDNTAAGTGTQPSHTYGTGGTYHVTLSVTDDDGSSSNLTKDVTVTAGNASPSAAFTSDCTNLNCTFTDKSTDADGTISSLSWNFGDNTTAGTVTPQSHTYASGNTYHVTLTVTDDDGATNALTKDVTVTPANVSPTAAFSTSCSNLVCTFTDESIDQDGTIASRSWDFGDQTPLGNSTPQSHTFTAGDTYQVTLTVTDNRSGTSALTKSVIVKANALPTASFSADCPQTGLTCTFTDGSTDPDGNNTLATWKWEFGDNQTTTSTSSSNPSHDYSTADVYSVKLTVTDDQSGTNSSTQTVTVGNPAPNAPPTAEFSWQCPAEGLTCTFADDGSIDSDGTVAQWSWDFKDGGTSTEQKPSHTFSGGGTFAVTLTVKDAKGLTSAPTSHDVTVTAPPPANTAPTAAFTTSCTNLACTFTDQSSDPDQTSSSLSRSWNYGDGITGTASSHTYAVGGNYTVTLTVTDGGGLTGTANNSVAVSPANAAPTAAFTASCTNLSCTFTDGSSDSDGSISSRSWTFGDNTTSTATSPSKTYSAAGTYTVRLTVTDNRGSSGTTTRSVTVSAPANSPPSAFYGSVCTKLSCVFTDRSTDPNGNGTIVAWSWAFGDGTTSTSRSPTHLYTAGGTYKPKLTVTDNQGAAGSITHIITIAP